MSDGPITVCLAGATGWAGSELAKGVAKQPDLELVAGVSRSHAGKHLGDVLGVPGLNTPVFGSTADALAVGCQVFVEYTHATVAKANVLAALEAGAHVVIGSSGLTDADLADIDREARRRGLGVLAVGNFALTVVLLQRFAEMAAKLLPEWEIIDYAGAGKADAPSGTARELASRLAQVRLPAPSNRVEETVGPREVRGATLGGAQVHSVRLPGYVIGVEAHFGLEGERLVLRQESGSSARPYVDGALLAIRKVGGLTGLHRGLDEVLDI
ncbi:MAG: 4-hydroxy-tetrahydrodipicolinate reductase [Trueperaceae bacterium]